MNRPETPSRLLSIPDVQSGSDDRKIAIDQVGIRGLRYPLPFADGDGPVQTVIATCDVSVALPPERKGTHMSRLVELLEERALPGAAPITVDGLRPLVEELLYRLDASAGRIVLAFPLFVRKIAPVSGVASLLDYDLRLSAGFDGGRYASTVTVSVPVTSLCPCSKEISDYGAHNQRSMITIGVRLASPASVGELLRIAEEEASCELFGILKRADEKYVTERAYDNPRFVEDLVRGVAARLEGDGRIDAYTVEAENFESIHNHSAYARIARGW
ncbi:MAG: GTP cyclohydrolase I FolE2 [Proteobacteria bacterium]|jgi:GTP cyclohydrolase FolE2|nr:GTP cyclohydrolase I FolE2 [Pseudomonadota bacterium]